MAFVAQPNTITVYWSSENAFTGDERKVTFRANIEANLYMAAVERKALAAGYAFACVKWLNFWRWIVVSAAIISDCGLHTSRSDKREHLTVDFEEKKGDRKAGLARRRQVYLEDIS